MNIYILNLDPRENARALSDTHLKQSIDVVATILCNAYSPGTAPRPRKNFDHEWCKWVRASKHNYLWMIDYGVQLMNEHFYRFEKTHPASTVILWCRQNQWKLGHIPWDLPMTVMPQVMPDICKNDDVVSAYKTYYYVFKKQLCKWTKRNKPDWWINYEEMR